MRNIAKAKKSGALALVCAIAFLFWWQGRSVADLAGVSGRQEIQEISIHKTGAARDGMEDVFFSRIDTGLSRELVDFLEGISCRYNHSSSAITYGKMIYNEDGNPVAVKDQALYDLQFYGTGENGEPRSWRSESISILDDGRVYADGKCYCLKAKYAENCITERLEQVLAEYPENIRLR